ncbi:S-type pyocin domain-containing protein [Serratia marcescens]|uniref:S-type pyocin domain-containing protein n=1 Tax=Serratia marcescens TaxID=615 RepID=UPI0039EC25FB
MEDARKVEAARKALFAKAGIMDAPAYTPEKLKAANAALAAAGAMVLNRAPAMLQTSVIGQGVMTTTSELAGWAASASWRAAYEIGSIRAGTVVAAGSVLGAFALGFYPTEVGAGSDRVPGRDVNLFALQASLAAAGRATIQPGMTSVDLPVRGFITTDDDGRQSVNFVRTGVGGVSPSVPVFRPVRDELTGLDKITLPAVVGAPARTILINPVPTGPAAPAHTGNGSPGPKSPVHTGIRQADSIVVTTFPAVVVAGFCKILSCGSRMRRRLV